MEQSEIKINIETPLFNLDNYTYSEKIQEPKYEDKKVTAYVFPTTTCMTSKLIIIKDRN